MNSANDSFRKIAHALPPETLLAVLDDSEARRFLVEELRRRTMRPAIYVRGVLELIKFSIKVLQRLNVAETENGLYAKLATTLSPDGFVGRILEEASNLITSAQIQSELIKRLHQKSGENPALKGPALSPEVKIAWGILSEVDKLGASVQDLRREPQPLLGLRLSRRNAAREVVDANSLVYSRQLTDFVGRREDLSHIASFLGAEGNVLWQVLTGPAGSGKSRLAQQFCLEFTEAEWSVMAGTDLNWDVGFRADPRLLATFSWGEWQPDSNKLIIFDDVSANAADMRRALLVLRERTDLKHKIRFLMLERAVVSTWWDLLVPPGTSDGELVADMAWQDPYEITKLSEPELLSVLEETFGKSAGHKGWYRANFRSLRRAARKMGAFRQPLLAMMAGLHFAEVSKSHGRVDGTSPRQLIRRILDGEKHRWADLGIATAIQESIAIATVVGGLQRDDGLAKNTDFAAYHAAIPSEPGRAAPLTPDLLGELFVLEYLNDIRRANAELIMRMCWEERPGHVRSFLERCIQDYPTHEALTQLLASPGDLNNVGFLSSDVAQQWFKLMFDFAEYAQNENKYRDMLTVLFRSIRVGFRPDERLTARLIGRAPDYFAARRILETFEELGFPLSTFHYNNLMRHAPRALVARTIDKMRARDIPLSEMTYGWMLRKRTGPSLDDVLGEMRRTGLQPTALVFNSALKGGDATSVVAIVERMMAMNVAVSHETTNALARHGTPGEAVELLCKIDRTAAHVHQTTFLIAARRGAGSYERARRILNHFRSSNRWPNGEFLAFLLDEAPTTVEQDEILGMLKAEGYRPDEVIYTILMDKADYAGAVSLLGKIKEADLERDAYVYNILIKKAPTDAEAWRWHNVAIADNIEFTPHYLSALFKRMDGLGAIALLKELDETRTEFDAYVFGTIFSKPDVSFEEKLGLYERMKDLGIEPNPFMATRLLQAAPNEQAARGIFADMVEYGIERNASVYALMIAKVVGWEDAQALASEYLTSGNQETAELLEALAWKAPSHKARELLDDMRKRGFPLDQKLFGHVLHGADAAAAASMFEHVEDYGITVTREILNIVIKKLAARDWPKASSLFEAMTKNGHGIDKYTIMPLLHGATPDEVARLLDAARDHGISIDPQMALLPLSRAQTYEDARVVFARLLSAGVQPTLAHYHVLTRKGDLSQIKHSLTEMRLHGLTPDTHVELNYLDKCDFAEAQQFLNEREKQGYPPSYNHLVTLFALGDYDQRLEVLERMRATGDPLRPGLFEQLIWDCSDFDTAMAHFQHLAKCGPSEVRVVGQILSLIETTRQLGRFVRALVAANVRVSVDDFERLRRHVRRMARGQRTKELMGLLDSMTLEPRESAQQPS